MLDHDTDEIQKQFLNSLDYLISLDKDKNANNETMNADEGTNDSKMPKEFGLVIARAKILKEGFEYILFNAQGLPLITDCIKLIDDIRNDKSYIHGFIKIIPLISLLAKLEGIAIIDFKEVRINHLNHDEAAIEALRRYIDTARVIRSNGYSGSIMENLESIISGDFDTLRQIVGAEDDSMDFSKAFVAAAAPSLEGKTQMAFVLEKVRPLYFTLGATYEGESQSTQKIYLNFEELNGYIEDFALEDVSAVLKQSRHNICVVGKSISKDAPILQRLTAKNLKKKHGNLKLSTLGLLVHLVKDAKNNYDTQNIDSRPSWLKYHAERNNFEFKPVAIDDIQKGFFDGYCLFLDEFRGHNWAVYIRNLAREVGLRCVVSNTNAEVANLVGKNQSGMSGSAGAFVWSIVVTELKLGNYETLNILTEIDDNIRWIHDNCISDKFGDDKTRFDGFFEDFKINQVSQMRPGLALAVANAISKLRAKGIPADDDKITFEAFFSYLVHSLSLVISTRKPNLKTSVLGQAANMALLLSPAYNRNKSSLEDFSNLINFLDCHLFYLINPSDPSKWVFITFPSKDVYFSLDYYYKEDSYPWECELTYFKSEELLTIFACMNLFSDGESFKSLLDKIYSESGSKNFDAGSTSNPNDTKLDGNRLEVLSTLCCSDSSHHAPGNHINSFSGQIGYNYFRNLFVNLKHKFNKRSLVSVEFDFTNALLNSFNVQNFLNSILIPFLYVSNFDLPTPFKNNTEQSSSSVYLGEITRTSNKSRIDIEFSFLNTVAKDNDASLCKIECKNRQSSLKYDKLTEIFERAQGALMSIIFCRKLGTERPDNLEKFFAFCTSRQINAYKFQRIPGIEYRYKVIPLSETVSTSPNLIVFIIEMSVISLKPVKSTKRRIGKR